MGTAALRVVHRLFSLETWSLGQIGRVVTTTLGAVPPPPCSVPQRLVFSRWKVTIGRGTAMSSARHRRVWCPRRKLLQRGNGSICLWAYK